MDSIEITAVRTAAATALAAKYLARPDARVITLVGCGTQGRTHIRALARMRRLEEVLVYDVNRPAAEQMARELGRELDLAIRTADTADDAIRRSDICITCTPSRTPFVHAGVVRPGTFVAGVGADNESKHELSPDLLAGSLIVTDVTAQCAVMGDLHHALESGAVSLSQVHAELGEIVAGLKPGRTRPDQIILFDSTGMALQDVAAAALVYRRCRDSGQAVSEFRFNS
jgi:ornithine cyclodeaminase/alanine dehydrogenase-like protein (mu-crystallin family)